MSGLWWELVALAVYGPLVALLHEAGHAALARAGGLRVTAFAVGQGRPLLRLGVVRGAVVVVGRWLLAGGACEAIPIASPTRRRAWFHGGGLLAQAVLAGVCLSSPRWWWVHRVWQFNLLVLVTNIVPWRWGSTASDGWRLWDVLRGGRAEVEVLPQRDALARAAARSAQVGAPLGEAWARLCLAWSDVVAGRGGTAAGFFEDPPDALLTEPYLQALSAYVEAEWHRQQRRPLAAVRVARAARVALADQLAEGGLGEGGAPLLALTEASGLVDLGEHDAARAVLSRVLGFTGAAANQALVVGLRAGLDDAVEELELATWRVTRRVDGVWLDPCAAALALGEAADRLDAGGRLGPTVGVRRASRALARRTVASASASVRPDLRRHLAGTLVDEDLLRNAPSRGAATDPTG